MSLTVLEIARVIQELQPLAGAIVQRAFSPEPRTALLEVRKPGESVLLLVCAEPGRTRLHAAQARPPSPASPFGFQGLLRAELTGLALDALEALPGERLAMLRFKGRDGARSLACELTGRHGNLFLLDGAGLIRGSAVPNLSERRDNQAGRPYLAPLARGASPEAEAETEPRFAALPGRFGLSRAIEAAYAERERVARVDARRRALRGDLAARRARLRRTVEKVEGDVLRTSRAEELRRRGELLKANLHLVRRGMARVSLPEYGEEGVREVEIALDPARSPRENLERAFHQYRRLSAGRARAEGRLAQVRSELVAIEARHAEVEAMGEEALLRAPLPAAAPLPGKRERSGPALPYREYRSPSGQRIRVGRGARENDALTFRLSRGNDVWLHARGIKGAHVVVPLGRDEALKDETLRDAALLAAHHSDARGQLAVEVAWTRVKYVRKAHAPGAVTFSQDATAQARHDPERIAQLLASGAEAAPS